MKSLKLNHRDRYLFQTLGIKTFQIGLTAKELTKIVASRDKKPPTRGLEKSMRRRLKQLEEAGILTSTRYMDELCKSYGLTKMGTALANETAPVPIVLKKSPQNIGFTKHSRLVASGLIHLLSHLQSTRNIEDYLFIEERLPLPGDKYFIPDAILGIREKWKKSGHIFYCEADRTTETYEYFADKTLKYLHFFNQSLKSKNQEKVLIFAPSLSRAIGLLGVVRQVLMRENLLPMCEMFLFSYLEKLQEDSVYGRWVSANRGDSISEQDFKREVF